MTLTEREQFIMCMTKIATSSLGQMVDNKTKQSLLKYIRDTHYKSISNKEWQEIANDIRQVESKVLDKMMNDALFSLGGKFDLGTMMKSVTGEMPKNIEELEQLQEKALAKLSNDNPDVKILQDLGNTVDEETKKKALKELEKYRQGKG